MNRTSNITQLRQDLSQLIGALEQTPANIDGVKKISQQLGRVVSEVDGLKKQVENSK